MIDFENKKILITGASGEHLEFIKKHGKGSHGTICLGERCTTMKDRKKEIGKGLLNAMLEQLGVDKDEL